MVDTMTLIEVFGAIWLMTAVFMLGRNYKWWLFYALANIPFSIVTLDGGNYGYFTMGLICALSGLRNFYMGRKQEKIDQEAEVMSHLR